MTFWSPDSSCPGSLPHPHIPCLAHSLPRHSPRMAKSCPLRLHLGSARAYLLRKRCWRCPARMGGNRLSPAFGLVARICGVSPLVHTRQRGTEVIIMRLRQISLWIGLVAVLFSSGCCCHRHCGWRHHGCCQPTTCCHPGGESVAPDYPFTSAPPIASTPYPFTSAPPIASTPGTLHAPMPPAK
jgi:hypothetical protein